MNVMFLNVIPTHHGQRSGGPRPSGTCMDNELVELHIDLKKSDRSLLNTPRGKFLGLQVMACDSVSIYNSL